MNNKKVYARKIIDFFIYAFVLIGAVVKWPTMPIILKGVLVTLYIMSLIFMLKTLYKYHQFKRNNYNK